MEAQNSVAIPAESDCVPHEEQRDESQNLHSTAADFEFGGVIAPEDTVCWGQRSGVTGQSSLTCTRRMLNRLPSWAGPQDPRERLLSPSLKETKGTNIRTLNFISHDQVELNI